MLLVALSQVDMRSKIDKMFDGVHINTTEDRSVLHAALRAPRDAVRVLRLQSTASAHSLHGRWYQGIDWQSSHGVCTWKMPLIGSLSLPRHGCKCWSSDLILNFNLQTIMADGKNVVPDVWAVLDKIKHFSEKVHSSHEQALAQRHKPAWGFSILYICKPADSA